MLTQTLSTLDILFENRNKEYGAYELRTGYAGRLWRSLLLTLLICIFLFIWVGMSPAPVETNQQVQIKEITLQTFSSEPEPPPPPPPVKPPSGSPQTSVVKFTPPLIVENPQDPPPAQLDLRGSEIGTFDRKGDTCQIATLPTDNPNDGQSQLDSPAIFESVEIEAQFPGGSEKWKQYLERNLRMVEGSPEGTYRVLVQFVVDVDGSVSEVIPLSDNGWGFEQEAVRVIKRGPKWTPARQNSLQVKAYRRQWITFVVSE